MVAPVDLSLGLKPQSKGCGIVRAEARTYLRGKSNCNGVSVQLRAMSTSSDEEEQATARAEADPLRG
jgi:hypothetical protein